MSQIEFVVPVAEVKYDSERGIYVVTLRARRLGKPGRETNLEVTTEELERLGKINAGDHVRVTVEKY